MLYNEQQNDGILAQAIAEGDESAFRLVFERYRNIIYYSARKWTKSNSAAEDITQEVFIKLWNSRHLLNHVTYFKSYLFKIAFNKTRNYLRNISIKENILHEIAGSPSFSNNVEDSIDAHECQKLINTALNRLSAQKQVIYTLARNDNKSYKEIAERLNISQETVRSHLYETTKFLRVVLKNMLHIFILGILYLLH